MKKLLTIAGAALALGFGLGWVFSAGPYRYFCKTTDELELLGRYGTVVGRIPAGTPLLAEVQLVR